MSPGGSQAPHAESRVRLVVVREERQWLVASGVEGAHDDPLTGEAVEHLAVGLHLLVDARLGVAVEEAELGAEQPDSFGAALDGARHVARRADVRAKQHPVAVARLAGALERRQSDHRGRGGLRRLVGAHDDLPRVSVDEQQLAVDDACGLGVADHGGEPQFAGDDRRVRGRATLFGDEREAHGRVERDRVGGRQVVGHQDERLAPVGNPRRLLPPQLGDEPVAHIEQVGRALGDQPARRAILLGELGGDLPCRAGGGEPAVAD